MTYEDELFERIVRFEGRLANYHEQLERALEDDRETQLRITWGVVAALAGPGFMIDIAMLSRAVFGELNELAVGFMVLVAFAAGGAALVACDRAREDWLKKLARLPRWSGKRRP